MLPKPTMLIAALVATLLSGAEGRAAPDVSEELAQAFRARMLDQPIAQSPGAPLGDAEWIGYYREAVTRQTRFAGVEQGIRLDRELRKVIRGYWGGNADIPRSESGELADMREPLAAYHAEQAGRYLEFAHVLRARIEGDPEDTAARGMLALSVLLHRESQNSIWFQYPRVALLGEALLDRDPVPPPACQLYLDDPTASARTVDCQVDLDARMAVLGESFQLALRWLDEIAAQDPDSTWIEVARLVAEAPEPEHPELDLPRSSATESPRIAVNVVVGRQTLSVDGVKLLDVLDGARVDDAFRRGTLITPLYDHLLEKRENGQALAEKGGRAFAGEFLLQADRRIPFDLLRQVLYTAGQAGFPRALLVVRRDTREHVIRTIHLAVIEVELPQSPPSPLTFPTFLPTDIR